MKYLRLFEGYQSESEIAKICKEWGIENWTLNSDGLVDVDGDVRLGFKGLNKLPLKFGHVTGDFDVDYNNLINLEGAPHIVDGDFDVDYNNLINLEGAPHTVGGSFYCGNNNNIRSFEGLVNISRNFYCGGSPVWEIWRIINLDTNKWDSEKMEFFNDLDIIRGDEIAIDRLNFFLEEIGRPSVESVKGYKNIY